MIVFEEVVTNFEIYCQGGQKKIIRVWCLYSLNLATIQNSTSKAIVSFDFFSLFLTSSPPLLKTPPLEEKQKESTILKKIPVFYDLLSTNSFSYNQN